MDISVVVTHYRSPEILQMGLAYLYAWKTQYEQERGVGTVEVIVSDSATIAATGAMMEEYYPHTTLLTEPKNIGYGKLVNRGVAHAKGELIFIMNADIVIAHPEELTKLIDYVREHEEIGIAGPQLMNFDNSHQPSAFRYYTPLTIILRRTFLGKTPWGKNKIATFTMKDCEKLRKEPTPVDWLMGSALLTRKKYLDRVGVFDERFFMYMEDVDLCRRFWEANLKVMYYPLASMYHFHGKASRSRYPFLAPLLNKYARIHLASGYKYFRKHGIRQPKYGI
ncbi:MAG: glycosyltransferase family 2 protein [Candidatus Spechtbacterales bacterium]